MGGKENRPGLKRLSAECWTGIAFLTVVFEVSLMLGSFVPDTARDLSGAILFVAACIAFIVAYGLGDYYQTYRIWRNPLRFTRDFVWTLAPVLLGVNVIAALCLHDSELLCAYTVPAWGVAALGAYNILTVVLRRWRPAS